MSQQPGDLKNKHIKDFICKRLFFCSGTCKSAAPI